jgi:hypothetical protein
MKDIALGSYEAACLMGLHFTRPKRLFDAGELDGRPLDPVWVTESSRQFVVYSAASAERNLKDFEAGRFGPVKNPRAYLHLRDKVLRRLAAEKQTVMYEDAIGTAEAAKILGVHPTMVQRLVITKKIVARQPWNPRNPGAGRIYIISRKSCEANRREIAALEAAGKKRGRKRKV